LHLAQAQALRALTRASGALLIVNDDIDLAITVAADGLHLGKDDSDAAAARAQLPPPICSAFHVMRICGARRTRTRRALTMLRLDPSLPRPPKPGAACAPLSLLTRGAQSGLHTVAIGGIDGANIGAVAGAGAHAAAVIQAVFWRRRCARRRARRAHPARSFGPLDSAPWTAINNCLNGRNNRSRVASIRPCAPFARSVARPASSRAPTGRISGTWRNKRYIDYIGSWGPMIVGHGHPRVVHAVQSAATWTELRRPDEAEVELAELLLRLVPTMDQVRLVSSGTEAAMSAIRLARGATGRDQIVKFEGCYHGHADSLLVKAGSGALTFGHPSSAGVPADLTRHTRVLDFNNSQQVEELFRRDGDRIACVIVEPIAGNMKPGARGARSFCGVAPRVLAVGRALDFR